MRGDIAGRGQARDERSSCRFAHRPTRRGRMRGKAACGVCCAVEFMAGTLRGRDTYSGGCGCRWNWRRAGTGAPPTVGGGFPRGITLDPDHAQNTVADVSRFEKNTATSAIEIAL